MNSLWQHRSLTLSLVRRDIQGRYRGSFGGGLWTFLHPLLLMLTYYFVFGIVLSARFPGDPSREGFVLYFLAGMLPWLAMSEAWARAPSVVIEHHNFIKKLVFPIEVLPVVRTLAALASEAVAVSIFLAMILATRGTIPVTALWLPAILIPQILLTLGVAYFLAATGAFLRDLVQIIGFLLTLVFFLTPICYPDSALPSWALPVLGKNPVYAMVRGYRAIFLEGRAPDWGHVGALWLLSAGMFGLGYWWFRRLQRSFSDVV